MRVKSENGEKILSVASAIHDSEEVTDHPEAAEADAADVGEPDDVAETETEETEE